MYTGQRAHYAHLFESDFHADPNAPQKHLYEIDADWAEAPLRRKHAPIVPQEYRRLPPPQANGPNNNIGTKKRNQETDGVALCVHYRRLKKDRPVPPSAAPSTKHKDEKEADPVTQEAEDNDLFVGAAEHEEKKEADPPTQEVQDNGFIVGAAMHKDDKEADPATQKVQDNDFVVDAAKHEDEKEADPALQKVHVNDFVVGADSGNTYIITIVVPKLAEDGTDGNLRQKDMRLLRLSRARYYRDSGIMNASKKT